MKRLILAISILVLHSCKPKEIPSACFDVTQSSDIVQFDATCSMGSERYFWSFGDGLTSSLKAPTHTYPAPGTYEVTLETYNNEGLLSSSTSSVTIEELCHECFCEYPDPVNPTVILMRKFHTCGSFSQTKDFYVDSKKKCDEFGGQTSRSRRFRPRS